MDKNTYLNSQYDTKMIQKYEIKIKDGNLEIGDWYIGKGDPEITNFRFVEKLEITTLKLFISNEIDVQFKSNKIQELKIKQLLIRNQTVCNLKVDNFELENLEVLLLGQNLLRNTELYNLAKFKKLHTLDVTENYVDLMNIHSVISLTKLSMRQCCLKNIDQITSLINLEDLDLRGNKCIDPNPLFKLTSLKKLDISQCNLKQIDQIGSLTNLEVLDISNNYLLKIHSMRFLVNLKELNISSNNNIDIAPLKNLVGLIHLYLHNCGLTQFSALKKLINLRNITLFNNYQNNSLYSLNTDITSFKYLVGLITINLDSCKLKKLSALKPLINLQELYLSHNSEIIITELQYLKNLTHLTLQECKLVSVYVLRPLVNLKTLNIASNQIIDLDSNLNEMKQLEQLFVDDNRISNFQQLKNQFQYKFQNKNKVWGEINFNKIYQSKPSEDELYIANMMKRIENTNIQLKQQIKNKRKMYLSKFNSFKQEINAITNHALSNLIQFTSSVVQRFQLMDQFGFE
ncbi:leucine-rich_repeat domain-containing protein [Hexamita inflata]|uniref:Leucine-rich repeat domain-containing protein n=1 Tax=Hexamita inflata TaxID=28002 RepID=A0AA86U6G0_9EUKA|nr:leucine-rich repeat domain-containing protein [Hexamita inflata]